MEHENSNHDKGLVTVNSEIFARVIFSRNLSAAKFIETKTLAKWLSHSAGKQGKQALVANFQLGKYVF